MAIFETCKNPGARKSSRFNDLLALPLVAIAEKISPSVVTLTAHNSNGEQIKFGTGFFVHKSGGIATNWHVISGAAKVTAKTSTGELLEVANVARYDPKLDVALCSLAETTRTFPAIADAYRKTPPRVGTSVAVLGTPEGLEQSLSQGIVSAIRFIEILVREFGLEELLESLVRNFGERFWSEVVPDTGNI